MGNQKEAKGPGFTIVDKRGQDEEPAARGQGRRGEQRHLELLSPRVHRSVQ